MDTWQTRGYVGHRPEPGPTQADLEARRAAAHAAYLRAWQGLGEGR
jgi:hypothetical protein